MKQFAPIVSEDASTVVVDAAFSVSTRFSE
jgi:hypothetical protein